MFENEIELEPNTVGFVVYDLDKGCTEHLLKSSKRVLEPFAQNYIWQRDQFSLHCSTLESPPWNGDHPEHFLWGVVSYGDSVDDEWFIVSLLWKLTETFPSLAIHVWDDDGEFLLIESAYELPKWITHDTSTNRVWIKQGAVHIIPREYPKDGELDVKRAIELLESTVDTKAKREVQRMIKERIGDFPEDTSMTQHWARCLLPLRAAYLLSLRPGIVSRAIEQFVTLDEIEKRALGETQYFTDQDFVMTMVKFHRCSYAQLMQMEFDPPESMQCPHTKIQNSSKAAILGMKLRTALELFLDTHLKSPNSSKETRTDLGDFLKSALEDEISVQEFTNQHPLFTEDDDGWLTNLNDLETELLRREKEQSKESHSREELDPNLVVDSFSRFVENVSSHEGAEIPENVEFSTSRFMHELRNALGEEFVHELQQLEIETSNSDPDEELSSNEEADLESVDSDDDSEFEEAYDDALRSELGQSRMQESFINKEKDSEESLPEVDLDLNLVQNLIRSHEEELGCPGPVGNIAGLMNLKFPHDQTS